MTAAPPDTRPSPATPALLDLLSTELADTQHALARTRGELAGCKRMLDQAVVAVRGYGEEPDGTVTVRLRADCDLAVMLMDAVRDMYARELAPALTLLDDTAARS